MSSFYRHFSIQQWYNVKRHLNGIVLMGFLLQLFACEKPQLPLENYTPSLVVISNFNTLDGIQVQVSKSQSPLDNGPTEYINYATVEIWESDRKSTRLNSSHLDLSRMPSSA